MFVQRNTLVFGVTPAVIEFNEGLLGVNDALSELDIQLGVLTKHMSNKKAIRKIRSIHKKLSVKGKKRRRQLRSIK